MQFLKSIIASCVIYLASQFCLGASMPDYWSFWDSSVETNPAIIDHSSWDEVVSQHATLDTASGIVSFSYGTLSDSEVDTVKDYVHSMERLDPRGYSRLEQQAYWMNLYNALSVLAVVENYEQLSETGFQQSLPVEAWDKKRVKIVKEKLSLNDIEHRILRPIFKDHRILFGLNCATLDCPNLADRAYTGGTIREQLRAAGSRFINQNTGVLYSDGVLHASRLFQDYLGDFAVDERTLTKVLAHYAEDMKALYVLGYTGSIVYTHDSRLNIR